VPQELAGRVALVTGASRGIGRAVALELARAGAHVIALGRTEGALTELDDDIRAAGGAATLVPLDLRDGPGIDRLGGAVHERWGRLDGLVGNAGVLGTLSPLGHIEPETWEEVIAVNLTANWRLIRAFDPLLRRSDAGRAVFLTSGAARDIKPFRGGYATSKAALEALVRTYAAEVAATAVRVNLFSPGPVATGMRAKAMPGEDPATLPTPKEVAPRIVELVLPTSTPNGEIVRFRSGGPG
jgi:NAD(P)-dependent dehydrogenase (short-subunit alcohol dehydrogenase family)